MSRPSKPKPAPAETPRTDTQIAATTGAPDPATPQGPETTGAASAPASAAAEAAPAPVVPKPATKAESKPEAKVDKTVPPARVMIVKGPAKGRWRAGRHFGPEAVEIAAADLSEEDIERLEGDPELTCAWSA